MKKATEGAEQPAPSDGLNQTDAPAEAAAPEAMPEASIPAEAAAPEATPQTGIPAPLPQGRCRPHMKKRTWILGILAAGILLMLFFPGDRFSGKIAFHEGKRAMERGDYATAVPCFLKAQGYAEEADSYLSYAQAQSWYAQGDYERAGEAFYMLGGFLDAEDMAIDCLNLIRGQRAAADAAAAHKRGTPLVTVSQYVDPSDGSLWYDFRVTGLPGSKVGMRESERVEDELIPMEKSAVTLRVPEEAFLPDVPLEEGTNTYLVTPGFIVYPPRGNSYVVESPPISISVPSAIISLGDEGAQTQQIVHQEDDPCVVIVVGTVDPSYCTLTLEGESIPVYEGGIFTYAYWVDLDSFERTAEGERELVLHLAASCPGYSTGRGTIRVVRQPEQTAH